MASGSLAAAIVDGDGVVMTQEALAEVLNFHINPTTLAAMYVDLGGDARDGARWLREAVWQAICKDRDEVEAAQFIADYT